MRSLSRHTMLMTDECAMTTSLTLLPGAGLLRWAARPFWQYSSTGVSNSTWLARGWGWKAPYSVGREARSALALPPWNSGAVVSRVHPSGFVRGPRQVKPQPQWGHPKPTGREYRTVPFGACGSRIITQLAERSNDGDHERSEAQEPFRVPLIVPGDLPVHPRPRTDAFATDGSNQSTTTPSRGWTRAAGQAVQCKVFSLSTGKPRADGAEPRFPAAMTTENEVST